MNMDALRTFAAETSDAINKAECRKVHDTHDYSSSSYSAFDDGRNDGIYEATGQFRAAIEKWIDEQETNMGSGPTARP